MHILPQIPTAVLTQKPHLEWAHVQDSQTAQQL